MQNPTKYYSNIQEHKVAKSLGWSVVTGSGAAPCTPGDVIGDEWLGECKTHSTGGKPIYFKLDVWNKIQSESIVKHRRPVLITDDGTQDLSKTWCLCLSNSFDLKLLYKVDIPLTIRKNISFSHQDLYCQYTINAKDTQDGEMCVYSVRWDGSEVLIMPFSVFAQLIKE